MTGFSIGLDVQTEIKNKTIDSDWAPFYLYMRSGISEICEKLNRIPYKQKSIFFASMANVNPEFLNVVQGSGLGIFVNSLGHLKIAREQGFGPGKIAFTSSAMDDATMKSVWEFGAETNLDSVGQIRRWKVLLPQAPYGIRCDIGSMVEPRHTRAGYFLGKSSRLGVEPEELREFKDDPYCKGLHLYVGTDILDLDYFMECYSALIEIARGFKHLEYLDLGGGFGVDDEDPLRSFDFDTYGGKVSKLFNDFSLEYGRPIRMVLEPGRILGCQAGYFVCRVVDIKERGGKRLIGVNASSAQFPRPLFYQEEALHPVVTPWNQGERTMASVYGCSTYSRDFLARDVMLPKVGVGDILVFMHAGSYCAGSRSDFLGFPAATEYFA